MPAFIQVLSLSCLLVLVILLVGCTPALVTTPTAYTTIYPPVTLTVVDWQATQALQSVPATAIPQTPRSQFSFAWWQTALAPPASPFIADFFPAHRSASATAFPRLTLEPPTCYALSDQSFSCLGQVRNQRDEAVRHVQLSARLLSTQQGVFSPSQTVLLEQQRLEQGQSAPYRLQYNWIDEAYLAEDGLPRPLLSVLRAEADPQAPVRLALLNEQAQFSADEQSYGRYQVWGRVQNQDQRPLKDVRAILTVYNQREQVVGYRVQILIQQLGVGEIRDFNLEVIPQVVESAFYHQLVLEAE